jgi:transposase-like protein/transposase Tn5 family protein
MHKHKSASPRVSSVTNPAPWAVHELAGLGLPDERLIKRAQLIMTQMGQRPGASLPQACGGWSESKAAYRFLDNDAVDPQRLLAPHTEATVGRMRAHAVVLALQDTTTLNYSAHPQTQGLGPTGNNRDKTLGLLLHSTLAVTVGGEPLGLLSAVASARDPRQFGSSRQAQRRNRQPIAQKESRRWLESLSICQTLALACPNTTIINVADREGDSYELMAQALLPNQGRPVQVLVRSQHNRNVQSADQRLWKLLSGQPRAGTLTVRTPGKTGIASRVATLSIRLADVMLQAPCLKEDQPALKLWAVEAREEHPPKGCAPIHWRLLTTLPVTTAQEAIEKTQWYAQRWQIEVLHKTLKSGCNIEQRQLETAERLRRVLMLDLIVAWRVLQLRKAGRESPEASAETFLQEAKWTVLWRYFNRDATSAPRPPTLRQAARWIGQLGGFLGRKSDGQPGPVVLWRGLQRLQDLTQALILFNTCG